MKKSILHGKQSRTATPCATLADVVEMPNHFDVIKFHRRQKRIPPSPHLEMLKLAHKRPDTDGIISDDIHALLDPFTRQKFVDIPFGWISTYISYYQLSGKFSPHQLPHLLTQLAKLRRKKVLVYIREIDKLFRKHAQTVTSILPHFKLFRFMSRKISGNTIHSYSSWSIFPLTEFCKTKKCYLYIIEKSAPKISAMYVDADTDEPEKYEFEFLLQRGVKFKILHQHTHIIADPDFRLRGNSKRAGKVKLTIVHIKLTGVKKVDPRKIKLPKPKVLEYTF